MITESPLVASITETPIDYKDITEAFNAIRNKRKDLDTLFMYANGPQPLKYSTEKLEELFGTTLAHFESNFCSVVIDAVLDRLELEGFRVEGNDEAGIKLTKLFSDLHVDIEADQAHEASLATSQAYVIVWKEDGETVVYYNDPRLCHVFYEDANPRKKRMAAKWFNRSDGSQEITLYYADRLEHWVTPKLRDNQAVEKVEAFKLESVEDNAFGVIPVFALFSPGEIFKVITLQDAINLLLSDLITSAEYGAIPQKYAISQMDPGNIKNGPNQWAWFPAGDEQGQQTSVGEFTATLLSNFSNEADKLVNSLFTQTRTPKHYVAPAGANVSGEALLAMEAPLVKKVGKRQKVFGAQWQEIGAFIAQLEGMGEIKSSQIKPIWRKPESIQPLTEMQTIQTATGAGIPLESALEHQQWNEKEIDAITKKKKEAVRTKVNTVRVPPPDNQQIVTGQ